MPTNSDDLPVTRAELKAELAAAVERLKEYIDERTHDAETRLLGGFADYSDSAGIRFRKLEAGTSNIDASTTSG